MCSLSCSLLTISYLCSEEEKNEIINRVKFKFKGLACHNQLTDQERRQQNHQLSQWAHQLGEQQLPHPYYHQAEMKKGTCLCHTKPSSCFLSNCELVTCRGYKRINHCWCILVLLLLNSKSNCVHNISFDFSSYLIHHLWKQKHVIFTCRTPYQYLENITRYVNSSLFPSLPALDPLTFGWLGWKNTLTRYHQCHERASCIISVLFACKNWTVLFFCFTLCLTSQY